MIKNMVKLGLSLAIFAATACVALAFVYSGTKTLIDGHEAKALERALFELFPDADGFAEVDSTLESEDSAARFNNVWRMTRNGRDIGLAIRVSAASYGGDITSLVGVTSDLIISGVKILVNKDTPGLGANAASPTYFVDRNTRTTFYGQFAGKSAKGKLRLNEDVQGITASTITSSAVTNSVRASAKAASKWFAAQGESK